jgi:hypothetical protein
VGDEDHLDNDFTGYKFALPILGQNLEAGLSRGDEAASNVSILRVSKGLDVEVEFYQVISSKALAALKQISCVH